jgi:hypothetical protein
MVTAPPAILLGAFIGALLPPDSLIFTVEIAVAAAFGTVAALAPRLRSWTITPLGVLGGLAVGMANGTAGALTDPWLFAIGAAMSAASILILSTAALRRLSDAWTPMLIGCRVLGGWAAAIAAITLGGRAAGIA